MPGTPRLHFDDDIARAQGVLVSAQGCPGLTPQVRDDMLRAAWMMGVGALDAYFSDAYASLLACTLIACKRQPLHRLTGRAIEIPDSILSTQLPASIHFKKYQTRDNWRWRMAARGLIEKQNYLNVDRICSVLNQFLRPTSKVFKAVMGDWIVHPDANQMLFSASRRDYVAADPTGRKAHRNASTAKTRARLDSIITRRHDCIHNCDRPRVAVQPISASTVRLVLRDVEFFVSRCDEHLDREFPAFLHDLGCTRTTIAHLAF